MCFLGCVLHTEGKLTTQSTLAFENIINIEIEDQTEREKKRKQLTSLCYFCIGKENGYLRFQVGPLSRVILK